MCYLHSEMQTYAMGWKRYAVCTNYSDRTPSACARPQSVRTVFHMIIVSIIVFISTAIA